MCLLKVNFCAFYDGNVSSFASYGNRVLAVTEMFDKVYKLLNTQDAGLVQNGNWSICWKEENEYN